MPLLAIFGEIGCDIRPAKHPGGARIGRASDWTCRSCFTCQTIQAPVYFEDARAPRHRFGLPPPPPEVCRCSIFNPRILPVGFRSLLRPSTSLKEAPRKTLRNATFSAGWRVRVVKVPSHAHASFDAIRLDLCISASPFESALASHRHRQPHPLDDFIVALKHANRAPPRTGSSIGPSAHFPSPQTRSSRPYESPARCLEKPCARSDQLVSVPRARPPRRACVERASIPIPS